MDQVKSNFYENQILEAIETVANGIVSKLKFDQTILCTITDDSKRKDGIYVVNDGTSSFVATSSETNYKKDMSVYVLIPQGDSDNQKTIVGKYVDDSATAVNYISAIDSFIEVKSYKNTSEYSLLANHPTQKFIDIPLNSEDVDDLQNNVNCYNCVGIQAKFKTDLAQEIMVSGNYGLVLTLYGTDITSNLEIDPRSYGIDCSDMYGDPYNYNFYFIQSKVFELPEDFSNIRINKAIISFYQKENFISITDGTKKELPYQINLSIKDKTIEMIKNPNLFVKDVEIKFGYSLSEISGECIKLYSLNDEKYLNRADTKDIQLKWFIQNGVKEKVPYTVVDTVEEAEDLGLEDHYSIYWYRQEISDKANDNLAGVYWNIIPEGIYNDNQYIRKKIQKTKYNPDTDENELVFEEDENGNQIPVMTILPELMYGLDPDPDGRYAKKDDKEDGDLILATEKNTQKYNVKLQINPRYDVNYSSMEKPYQYSFSPSELLSQEQIKAILVRNEYKEVQTPGEKTDMDIYIHFEDASKYFEAKEVAYINANPGSLNLDSVQFIRNMRLECQDLTNGVYKVYNSIDNSALGSEASRNRILKVIFDTYSTKDIPTAEAEGCSVKWKIPKNNSMIEPRDFELSGPVVIQKPGAEIAIEEDGKEILSLSWEESSDGKYYECSYDWASSIAGTDDWHEGAILTACYGIKKHYSQAYNNNTIICEITKYKKKYVAEMEFLFGESGTNGTGYTLSIRLDNEYDLDGKVLSSHPVTCVTADTSKKVKLIATLFDQFGNDISDTQSVEWSFKDKSVGLILSESGSDCFISYNNVSTPVSSCYGIVRAISTVEWKKRKVQLEAYLPIGIKPEDSDIFTYNGTTRIIYDAQGSKSTYEQIHNLFDVDNQEIVLVDKWNVSILNPGKNEIWDRYIPYFIQDKEGNPTNILSTRDMYFTELSTKQMVIQALDSSNTVLYQQSVLYDQNRFGSALFNEWDGSLVIDETDNKILSALIGAGKKESDNTFSGVLMGNLSKNEDGVAKIKTGLLGFKNSLETFGFYTDGTAFIGPSGQGRIEFDGEEGIIESFTGNTQLNLTTGAIYLANDDKQSAKVILDSTGDSGYFSIKHKDGDKYKNLIYIGPSEYYLQSKEFAYPTGSGDTYVPGTGVRFDLNDGKLYGYNFLIQAGEGDDKLIINSSLESNPLTIGSHFSVSWDGKMKATEGEFSGTLSAATGKFSGEITAETGTIGGWTINKNGLHNGGAFNDKGTDYTPTPGASYAVFSPQGTTLVRSASEKIPNVVFNIGKNLAIDKDGVIHATGAQLGGYTTSTDFDGLNGKVSDIDTLIGKMNSSYGSIIKYEGDLGSTATFLVKGDDVNGYKGEGYYNSTDKKFYSKYNKEDNTYTDLISAVNGYVYYDISTSQMYLYKNNQYSVYNAKFFNVSKEGLLMANNAVISGTIYATNGWFSGGITASEGHFGNWEILNNGELKGTPSGVNANEYNVLLNPNFSWNSGTRTFTYTHSWLQGSVTEDTSDTEQSDSDTVETPFTEGTVCSKTVSVSIDKNTSLDDLIQLLQAKINAYPYPSPTFNFNELSVFTKIILRTKFYFLKTSLIDANVFKIRHSNNHMIFGIDGFGKINWSFANTSGTETSRFYLGSNIDDISASNKGLVLSWLDWTNNKSYTWSFLDDGSFIVDKLKTAHYSGKLGGFQLNSENMDDRFWNNSLFTTNTVDNQNYVGFLRGVGSSSKSLSNVFIGCKQYGSSSWPTNAEWSEDAKYNFYIRFDGKAKFESFHTKKYSDKKYGLRPNGEDDIEYVLGAQGYPWDRIILGTKKTLSTEKRIDCIRLQSWAEPFRYFDEKFYTVANIGLDTTPSESKHTNFNRLYFTISTYDFYTSSSRTSRDEWDKSNKTSAEIFFEADYYGDKGDLYVARFAPSEDGSVKLGSGQLRWAKIYAMDMDLTTANFETAANLSDARLKDVQSETLLSKILTVYDNLKPVVYKYKNLQENETHSRTHVGFLAQEVEQTIMDTGLSSEDCAIVQIAKTEEAVPGCEDGKKYYLNYNELHGLHTLKNQEQDKRILELEQKVQYLENKILELSGKGV